MFKLVFTILFLFSFVNVCLAQPDAELVHYNTDILIKNGKIYKTITSELRINNRNGEQYAEVSIPYSGLIRILKLDAYIKDSKGNIIKKLQKNDIVDKSAISDMSLYEDSRIREFKLKHNTYPYTIFLTYELRQEEFLQIIDWTPVINRKIPTLDASLNLEVPDDYSMAFKSRLTDTFNSDTTDKVIRYSWTASYKDIIVSEAYSPSFYDFLPEVMVVPARFNFDRPGSFESWQTYGAWTSELIDGLSFLPDGEKARIMDIVKNENDTREKIRKLYNYLQDNTRYINITIETGGIKPYPASFVAEKKYGDCKALTNYFRSVLAVAGINSFYSEVNAGNPTVSIDKGFPSQQFNHAILCVPVSRDTIWLDCTSDLPFGYLGTFTQNRDIFIIDGNNSHFTRTPALSVNNVKEIRNVKIHRNIQEKAVADFTNFYEGEKYETLYYIAHSVSDSDRPDIIRDHFVESGFELMNFSLPATDRNLVAIYLKYSAISNRVYRIYGNDLLIRVIPFSIPKLEDPSDRKLPVQINYPVNKTDSLEYDIPAGYHLAGDLNDQTISTKFGKYDIAYTIKGNKVNIVKNFILYPATYSNKDQYTELVKFLHTVTSIEKNNKILTSEKN